MTNQQTTSTVSGYYTSVQLCNATYKTKLLLPLVKYIKNHPVPLQLIQKIIFEMMK